MATIQTQGRGYKITVSQGYDYAGKRLRQYMTWIPEPGMSERQIKKELERQAVLFEEKVLSGATSNGNMRFADFAEKYMTEYAQLYLKPKTIATYTEHLRRINQAIGHIRLCDLRTGHINSFYQNLQEMGIRNRTTALCKIDLRERIGTQRGALTAFADRTGVSRTTVKQTSNYVSGKGVYVSTPKTEDSDRYLRISRTAVLILLEYKRWQDEMREKVGDAWEGTPEDDRIFTNEVGRPMFPTSITQWMGKFIKRTGLPPACVHSLRHTYASLLIADKTPLVVVANNLGHAQTSTTSDIYSHVIASAEAKAAQVLDKFSDDIHPKFTPSEEKEGVS